MSGSEMSARIGNASARCDLLKQRDSHTRAQTSYSVNSNLCFSFVPRRDAEANERCAQGGLCRQNPNNRNPASNPVPKRCPASSRAEFALQGRASKEQRQVQP